MGVVESNCNTTERGYSCVDWNVIREEYIRDESSSYRKLAQKYKVGVSTICSRAKAEKWAELREQIKNDTITKSVDKISQKKAAHAAKFTNMVDTMSAKLEKAIKAVDPKDTNAVRRLTASLCDFKELIGIKSDADSREQEARIANLCKQADKENDTATEIEVVFKAGPEEWNE